MGNAIMSFVEYCEILLGRKLSPSEKEYTNMVKNLRPTETLIQTPRGYYIHKEPHRQERSKHHEQG